VERLAFTDPLTGLANRRAVDERLHELLAGDASGSRPVSIVLADINRLKQVNDTFGHEAGDRLIFAVAESVSRASGLARDSLAARIGGDEFCVVVSGEPLAVAVRVAEELCRAVDGQPMTTGVSCGVASTEVLAGPVDSPVRLFRLADAAQYRAKRAASRHPVVAGQSLPEDPGESPADRRVRRGRLHTDVPAALESGLAVLDGLSGAGARHRLEAVADHLRDLLDAAGWWLSAVAPGVDDLVTVSSSVQRYGVAVGAEAGAEGFAAAGTVFDLRDFPVTRRAIDESRSFFVEAGMPGNDPAEEATLVTAGYLSVLGAGAADTERGWLVEVYADPISLPMGAFEPVLRALVAVAVAGAAGTADGTAAGTAPAPGVPRQTDR
jgi:diguanylate cyclase (GGDEF)-like protein